MKTVLVAISSIDGGGARGAFSAVLMVLVSATAAAAPQADAGAAAPNLGEQQCHDIMQRPSPDQTQLKRMYQIASLLEWSLYKTTPAPLACTPDGGGDPIIEAPDVDVLELLSAIVDVEALAEDAALLSTKDPRDMRYHITCHRDAPQIELTISVGFLRDTYLLYYYPWDGEGWGNTLFAYLDIGLAIPETERWGIREEIETKLLKTNNPNGHKQTLYLVRGTDLHQDHIVEQLNASIQGAYADSCVFRAAELIIRQLGDIATAGGMNKLTIAGMSLGGAAVQHVAYYQQADPDPGPNAYYTGFQAYSFNGLGLPPEMAQAYDPSANFLRSYSINGDAFMDIMRFILSQTEVGIKYRYFPGDGQWRQGKRHEIYAVVESLCRCANKTGRIDVSN